MSKSWRAFLQLQETPKNKFAFKLWNKLEKKGFLPVQSKCGFFDSTYALVKLLVIFREFEAMFFRNF